MKIFQNFLIVYHNSHLETIILFLILIQDKTKSTTMEIKILKNINNILIQGILVIAIKIDFLIIIIINIILYIKLVIIKIV